MADCASLPRCPSTGIGTGCAGRFGWAAPVDVAARSGRLTGMQRQRVLLGAVLVGLATAAYMGLRPEAATEAPQVHEDEGRPPKAALALAAGAAAVDLVDAGAKETPLDVLVLEGSRRAAGATVRSDGVALGQTGADGTVTVTLRGTSALLDAQRGARFSGRMQVKIDGPLPGPLVLVLQDPLAVAGQVLSKADGRPVAGAKVKVVQFEQELHTGPDGRFRIDTQGEPMLGFRVEADGFAAEDHGVVTSPDSKELRILLRPGTDLLGRVIDHDGQPVAKGKVYARDVEDQTDLEEAAVDANGAFAFHHLALRPLFLRFKADDLPYVTTTVQLPAPPVVLKVGLGGEVSGTVYGPDGKPLGGAGVEVLSGQKAFEQTHSATADAQGHFSVTGSPGGWATAWAHKTGFGSTPSSRVQVPDEGFTPLDLHFDKVEHTLATRVVDEAGKPVSGARVQLYWGPKTGEEENGGLDTDAQGLAVFSGLSGTTSRAEVTARGFEKKVQPLAQRDGEATFTLRAGRRLRGRVLGPGGKTLTRFQLDDETLEASDGRFDLGWSPRATEVVVDGPGVHPRTVSIPHGEGPADLGDIQLDAMPVIQVRVHAPDGAPLPSATVWTVDVDQAAKAIGLALRGKAVYRAETDLDGLARIHLNPGPRCVVATHPDFLGGLNCPLEVPDGPLALDVTVKPGSFVVGHVLRDGKPIEVRGVFTESSEGTAVADTDGNYRLGPVSPGKHTVFCTLGSEQLRAITRQVELEEGKEQRVDFDLKSGGSVQLSVHNQPATASQMEVLLAKGDVDLAAAIASKNLTGVAGLRFEVVPLGGGQGTTLVDSLDEGVWNLAWHDASPRLNLQRIQVVAGQAQVVEYPGLLK